MRVHFQVSIALRLLDDGGAGSAVMDLSGSVGRSLGVAASERSRLERKKPEDSSRSSPD